MYIYIYIYICIYVYMYRDKALLICKDNGAISRCEMSTMNLRHVAVQMIRRAAMQVETTVDGGGLAY